uniref:SMP-LTD domain-containing protein n=1 Tax=Varanus komodoensis TaxID=61221 RepID=A0A8D2LMI7_VARKO
MKEPHPKELAVNLREKVLLDYHTYMSQIVPPGNSASPSESPCASTAGSPTPRKEAMNSREIHMAWVNAVLGRMFWDFLREKYWADHVSNKIQKKLGRIKLPYFMNELTLTELDMGSSIPRVLSASSPTLDSRGKLSSCPAAGVAFGATVPPCEGSAVPMEWNLLFPAHCNSAAKLRSALPVCSLSGSLFDRFSVPGPEGQLPLLC